MNKLACLLLCISTLAHSATLELVTLTYPPYAYQANNQVQGIAVDIVKEAFDSLGQPINISVLPWARALKYVQSGKADGIFTVFKTPEREVFLDYSTEVLLPQVIALYVKSDTPVVYQGQLAELAPYMIAAVHKVSYGKTFDQAVVSGLLTNIRLTYSGDKAMELLLSGRVMLLVSNRYGALDSASRMAGIDAITELRPELENVASFIAFSKQNNLAALRGKFDAELTKMKQDGRYQRIIDAYFERQSNAK
ncbi:substrate-binding periplasmic protein [Motilimonas sp. KMU-193]|uniref:substrate-binding periplasmic protein n=1 Tax=Motilimonas sp. KMU-193 TaxID=3388668 RepID=UPI00396B1737